jgi:hypothetical protein
MALYNTTGEEGIDYLSENNAVQNNIEGTDIPPRNPYRFSSVITNPKKGTVILPGVGTFVRSGDEVNRYDKGFAGESYAELEKHRIDTQSTLNKGFNSIVGGMLSGIGTFVEDIGYITDIDTYKAMFSDIDFNANKSLGLVDYLPNQLVSSGLQKLGESIKGATEENMPIYENQGTSVASQVFNWNALKGTVDSIMGFALTGWGAGAAVKGMSKLAIEGLVDLGKYSKALLELNKVKKIPSVVESLANVGSKLERTDAYVKLLQTKNPGIMNELGPGASAILTKGAEARMEGLDSYNTALSQLNPLIEDGTLTKQEAIKEANKAGNHAFDMTMMTVAGDALMLRKLFPSKTEYIAEKIMKPGLRSTLLEAGKDLVLGAPKEGLEEMWQQKAQMEGLYDIYKDIKSRLNDDQRKSYAKQAGFNPDSMSDDFFVRSLQMMSSTQAQVAGWLGALAGPFQSTLVGSFTRKERNKKQLEDYNRQQEVYNNNKALFNASNQFVESVKVTEASEAMKKVAAEFGNDEMMRQAKDLTFFNIAAKNFINGTTDQLREVLKANPGTESTKFLKDLDSMEEDWVKSKKYINSEDVFLTKRNIDIWEKQLKAFENQVNDPKTSEKDKKDLLKTIEKGKSTLNEFNNHLEDITSKSTQLDLIEEAKKNGKLLGIYSELPSINSVYQLQQLQKEFPNDEAIATRIKILQNENNVKKTTSENKKPSVKTKTNEESSFDNFKKEVSTKTPEELQVIKDKLNKETKDELTLNKLDHIDELLEGTVNTMNDVPVYNNKDLETNLKQFFNQASEEDGLQEPIIPSESDIEYFQKQYNNNKTNHKSIIDRDTDLIQTAIKLYNNYKEKANITTSIDTSGISANIESSVNTIFEAISLTTLQNNASEDLPNLSNTEDTRSLSEKIAGLVNKLRLDYLKETNKDIFKSFNDFIDLFNKVNPVLTKQHYVSLVGEFVRGSRTFPNLAKTYEEHYNIVVPDYTDPNNMITESIINHTIETATKYIQPGSNSEAIMDVYLNDDITNDDKKNEMPTTSMAYLSQEYILRKDESKVSRFSSINDEIKGDSVLNPNKYNEGDIVNLSLDTDYDGPITLSSGVVVNWKDMLEASKTEKSWKEFSSKHKMSYKFYETIYDYWPIKITSDEDGTIAYVHNTAWINKLNVADNVIENSRQLLKDFRKSLVSRLSSTNNTPIQTQCTGKVIEMAPTGGFKGGVINRKTKPQNTAKAFPSTELQFADKTTGTLIVKNNKSASNNIINAEQLINYNNNIVFAAMPLGKKNGIMQYWAEPIYNSRLTPEQAKTIRTALEIYIKQDTAVNSALYDAYLNNPSESIDLKTMEGLTTFLNKLIHMYYDETLPVEKYVENKALSKPVPVLTVEKGVVKIGKTKVISLSKKSQVDAKTWDKIENLILKEMLFNINKKNLNTKQPFYYTGLDIEGNLTTFEGTYNEFMKPNTTTLGNSTELKDGGYGYVIQHITRFDMMIKELEEPIVEKKQESIQQPLDIETTIVKKNYETISEIKQLLETKKMTYDEFYNKFLIKVDRGELSLEELIKAMTNASKADKFNDKDKYCIQ